MPKRGAEMRAEAIEAKEARFEVPTDLRTQEILFRLSGEDTHAGRTAKKAWIRMRKEIHLAKPEDTLSFIDPEIKPEEWRALQRMIEEERIMLGEQTPRVKEFLASREALHSHLRGLREQLQWEQEKVEAELIRESEKKDSMLYQELNTIVQDIAREFGFDRPVILEVTRSNELNAFVKYVAKEGGLGKENQMPLRLYVHAGFMDGLRNMLKEEKKELTRDHLAGVIGHELAHLKQPAEKADEHMEQEDHMRLEYDADVEGLEALDRAGYNPRAAIEMWETFQKKFGNNKEAIPHYLSKSHPLTENRVKELWQTYQRPDQPFFSSQKTPTPVSEASLKEVDHLLRKELKKELEAAATLEDFEKILARLEQDPSATLRDIEIVGTELKKHMDARQAIAQAHYEITAGTGMAEALVYVANYLAMLKEKGADPGKETGVLNNKIKSILSTAFGVVETDYGQWGSTTYPPKQMRDLVDKLCKQDRLDPLAQDYEAGLDWPDEEQKALEFVREHTANEIVEPTYFKTAADLFDQNNEAAAALWKTVYDTLPAETTRDALFEHAKYKAIKCLAPLLCFGMRYEKNYHGNDVDEKADFLKLLKEAVEAAEGTRTDADSAAAFIDAAKIARIKAAIQERVAVYKKPSGPAEPAITGAYKRKRAKEQKYIAQVGRIKHLLNLPDEVFQHGDQATDISHFTPMQKNLVRYFRLARRTFEREMDPRLVRDEYKIELPDNAEARQMLFEDIFRDFFFETEDRRRGGKAVMLPLEKLRATPELFDFARLLYITPSRLCTQNSEFRKYFNHRVRYGGSPDFIKKFYCGDSEAGDSLETLRTQSERLRIRVNQPGFAREIADHLGGYQGLWEREDKETMVNIVEGGRNPWQAKINLFTNFVRKGVFPDSGKTMETMRDLLLARAQAEGVPSEFFAGGEPTDIRTRWERLTKKPFRWDKATRDQMGAMINRIFSEEFMRLFADSELELKACDPQIIKVVEEKT